jgi:hypothetical protein
MWTMNKSKQSKAELTPIEETKLGLSVSAGCELEHHLTESNKQPRIKLTKKEEIHR